MADREIQNLHSSKQPLDKNQSSKLLLVRCSANTLSKPEENKHIIFLIIVADFKGEASNYERYSKPKKTKKHFALFVFDLN